MLDGKIKVWTKQHKNILKDLESSGRYIVKKEYIQNKMEEHAGIYLDTYHWLRQAAGSFSRIPEDVKYPVWLSVTEESKISNSDGNVQLELLVDKSRVTIIDLEKWGYIVNYMYIPKDKEDERQHEDLLRRYGVDDSTAYMSPFYPNIKRMIYKSWDRLFDDTVMPGVNKVGIIWEVKQEWIIRVEQ